MEAGEEVVGAEVGEEYREDGNEEVEVQGARTAEETEGGAVERYGIDQEGDQGAGLFGIPSPVTSPRLVGPYRSDEDPGGEKKYCRHEDDGVDARDVSRGVATFGKRHGGENGNEHEKEVGTHHEHHVD